MALRSFDVVLFGATGYIGQALAKYIHENQIFAKWAILGRNHKKLSALIAEMTELNAENLPDILIADAQDIRSLRDIFMETRLILNCILPTTLYKDIIEACLMARCDYVDLCSDLQLIESNFLEFQAEAVKKGVCIMHGFGFDAAVADLGTLLARSVSGNGACSIVESFLKIDAPNGFGTRRLVDNIVHYGKNEKNISLLQDKIDDKFRTPIIKHPGAKIEQKQTYYFDKRLNMFATPSFAPEHYLIPHSLRTACIVDHQTTLPQYHAYMCSDNYLTATSMAFHATILHSLSSFSLGRTVARSFPEMLTDGVLNRRRSTAEQIQSTSFQMIFISKGFMRITNSPADSDVESGHHPSHSHSNSNRQIHHASLAKNSSKNWMTAVSANATSYTGGVSGGNAGPAVFSSGHISANVSEISDLDSTRSLRRVFVMERDQHRLDVNNIGTLPCSFFGRERTRSRYLAADVQGNTPFEKWIKVIGPDPYYTSTVILAARLTQFYLLHRNQQVSLFYRTLPVGGVLTPSRVFYRLPMVFDHLTDYGIEFTITSEIDLLKQSPYTISNTKDISGDNYNNHHNISSSLKTSSTLTASDQDQLLENEENQMVEKYRKLNAITTTNNNNNNNLLPTVNPTIADVTTTTTTTTTTTISEIIPTGHQQQQEEEEEEEQVQQQLLVQESVSQEGLTI
jgi:short subunit dehydrogenase-like uncharacterized protein